MRFRVMSKNKKAGFILLLASVAVFSCARVTLLDTQHNSIHSVTLYDRHGAVLVAEKNNAEEFAIPGEVDTETAELLLAQEDQQYYYHLGFNPFRAVAAIYAYVRYGERIGSSTIPQQLAKILNNNEGKRTVWSKIEETIDAILLSILYSKKSLLNMYANSVYMGNSARGLHTASLTYFGKALKELSKEEKILLVETIPAPTSRNPAKRRTGNIERPYLPANYPELIPLIAECKNHIAHAGKKSTSAYSTPHNGCTTTIDKKLQDTARALVRKKVSELESAGVTSGAAIILDSDSASVLALVGTAYPVSELARGSTQKSSIDMTREPRPIGSTIKPLIYAESFSKELRPYSYIEDREYSFPTAGGSNLYPKNYDGTYRGTVTAHYALSNSLNVPAVKALEFVGLPSMFALLQGKLGLEPVSPLERYGYGIALGGLETTPLKLAEMLLVFPREGLHSPLRFFADDPLSNTRVFPIDSTRLVTSILSDRYARVDQFGLTSLSLPFDNYAVKTGTSRDYHDSWTVGYTPETLVLTWLGNPENKPLRQISGGIGAGSLWKEIMLLLPRSTRTFSTDGLVPHPRDSLSSYALASDTVAAPDLVGTNLILFPHDGDVFTVGSRIPIHTRVPAQIFVNDLQIKFPFTPKQAGTYRVRARNTQENTEDWVGIIIK